MFGYVRPLRTELLVREFEEYRGVYCALCKDLGRSFGGTARLLLSYDCTFYALLAMALSDSALQMERKRCTVNPAKACWFLSSEGDEYRKASALSVLISYHKLKDNVRDDGGVKSLCSRLACFLLRGRFRKARAAQPQMAAVIAQAMAEQQAVEQDPTASIDRCCEPTARMMGALLGDLRPDGEWTLVLREFGYYLGRWIYTMDAADDLEADLAAGRFNPFVGFFSLEALGKEGKQKKQRRKKSEDKGAYEGEQAHALPSRRREAAGAGLTDARREALAEGCNEVLNRNFARMFPAFQLLPLERFEGILENIVKEGLPEMQREILFLHRGKEKKKHGRSVSCIGHFRKGHG